MKKLLLLSLLAGNLMLAQENTSTSIFSRKHEVKVGVVKLLAGPIFEATYEYIQNNDFTYGVSILKTLNSEHDYFEEFSVTPFARFYFQETKEFGAKGFFVEGFGKYSTGYYNKEFFDDNTKKAYSAGALGLSLGKKWINHTGFVFEALVGVGRTLGNSDNMPAAVFRGDLNLGYRF